MIKASFIAAILMATPIDSFADDITLICHIDEIKSKMSHDETINITRDGVTITQGAHSEHISNNCCYYYKEFFILNSDIVEFGTGSMRAVINRKTGVLRLTLNMELFATGTCVKSETIPNKF